MISFYERNVLDQPKEWKRLLRTKLPSGLETAFNLSTPGRLVFVGIGSSYWSARFPSFSGEIMQMLVGAKILFQFRVLIL